MYLIIIIHSKSRQQITVEIGSLLNNRELRQLQTKDI